MKRLGKNEHIINEIIEYGNICNSIDIVLRGRKRKRLRAGRFILAHRDEVIKRLQCERGALQRL